MIDIIYICPPMYICIYLYTIYGNNNSNNSNVCKEREERERDGDVAIVDRRSSSSSCRFHLDGGIDSTSRRLSSCGDN
jgi:hypothetical protein